MEEARYWMWTKQNTGLSSEILASTRASSYGDSWEEQAFAEDAAGPLGGCVWPPRSYTCTFCRREFRSAQALGGHMNVHRRDRARLKQSPNPNNTHLLSPKSTSLGIHQLPSQVSNLDYKNDDPEDQEFLKSPSRVSEAPIMQVMKFEEKALLGSSFSPPPILEEQQKATSMLSPLLWSSFVADRYSNIRDLDKREKNFDFLDSKCGAKRNCVEADLSVSLNFVFCKNDKQKTAAFGGNNDDSSCKRRRTDDATVLFFPKQSSVGRNSVPPELKVFEISPTSSDDLDLELRLGA